ncbi:7-cyano-7-deazaguanine synthase QueC [Parvularcula maris]|uniref:7-cyano-7-deazaguanine synthase n=1 Tax=Parvularcula maris TaxID=2965077 RepID=A0A9X2LAY0_9PROT|nr:7-cyano-7-deazaguanine synthase QueC [Parvularcula maris]MCQ8186385.1 7-cyano-7-deazaguanine synthase QueC [Parvularcula maris]
MLDHRKALVLFSGGQDSAICLAFVLARYARVETVGFTYGQRHEVELRQRDIVLEKIRELPALRGGRLGRDHMIDLGYLSALGATAMTEEMTIRTAEDGLPNTFVPGRNLAFFTAAAALAHRRGIGTLVGGMCQTDYSGYPDCRSAALRAQERTLQEGLGQDIRIETPLMHLTKEESWRLAENMGGEALVALVEEHTHTCYLGDRIRRHPWGYGCGTCPACELRAQGHEAYRARAV